MVHLGRLFTLEVSCIVKSLVPFKATLFVAGLVILPVAAIAGPGEVEITDAWIRALPPAQSTTAAYLTLHNRGTQAVVVRAGSAEGAGRLEIHTTREVDGLMRMQQLSTLQVPAGGSVVLEPGGTHLMLLDLERMPAPGETRQLCLQPAGGEQVCVSAPVRKDADGGDHHHHH